ncbi:MAG: hypothetical protein RJB47_1107 [Pseudomonadota bacterium]
MPCSHSIIDSPTFRAVFQADNKWHLVLDLIEAR